MSLVINNNPTIAYKPDSTTIRMREASLIRSVFDYHEEPWGPNVTWAIAWMAKGELEDASLLPIVDALLELKVELGRMPTEAAVGDLIMVKLKKGHMSSCDYLTRFSGVLNGIGGADSLPLSIQESEALDMIAWYKGKSLWRVVAQAYQKMLANPYDGVKVARELKDELEKSL